MHSAMRSRLEPFKKFVRMLRSHLDGILPWTTLRLSNGAVEGMNNKIKLGWSPWLRQTVKTLLTVRCKFIVPDPGTDLGWACR
jgi:hypothetical protein